VFLPEKKNEGQVNQDSVFSSIFGEKDFNFQIVVFVQVPERVAHWQATQRGSFVEQTVAPPPVR